MRKRLAFTCAAVLVASATLLASRIFGDAIPSPFSGKDEASIGSWSDEVWEAAGFYQLVPCGVGAEYKYCYAATRSPSARRSDYIVFETDAGTAGVPMDLVVTEWNTTGHIHFSAQ